MCLAFTENLPCAWNWALMHLFLISTQLQGRYCYYLHFMDEETCLERINHFPKVMQKVSDGTGIQTHAEASLPTHRHSLCSNIKSQLRLCVSVISEVYVREGVWCVCLSRQITAEL